jgi:hypothetical protein
MWCCRSWAAALDHRQAISMSRNIIIILIIISPTVWAE